MIFRKSLYGSHGTSASKAKQIDTEGWKKSAKGRFGPGVYFWVCKDFLLELGIEWYRHNKDDEIFKDDSDKRWAVVFALIKSHWKEVIDIDSSAVVKRLHSLKQKLGYGGFNYQKSQRLIQYLVSEIESKSRKKVKIILRRIPAPPTKEFRQWLSDQQCAIVRDVNTISIQRIEIGETV